MQADEGESLDVQQRIITGYATVHGLTVAQVFVERGVSGSKPLAKRPAGSALIAALGPGEIEGPRHRSERSMNTTTISDDELFLMVNIRGRSSGLPMNIWIGPRGRARHAARVKVQMDHRQQFDIDQLAVVSVDDDPPQVIEGHLDTADLDLVRRYIALNKQAILDHWNEKTDGLELSRALKPLP